MSENTGLDLQPLPLDLTSPQFTLRAVLTGMILGAVLSVCNVYAGLRMGLAFNMSITAALVGYGFWAGLHHLSGKRVRGWGILENNINQTACSSGASVASAGLVAPIPALALITGHTLDWHYLALWVLSVCLVGIIVAIGLRRQMLLVQRLPFPVGIASAETLRELHAKGSQAVARVLMLFSAAVVAAAIVLARYVWTLRTWAIPGTVKGFTLKSLTFAIDPSPLLYAVGGLIGFRACISLLVGAVIAFGVLAPPLVRNGNIRLTTVEPLANLPAPVAQQLTPHGYLQYNDARARLEWSGVMTATERDKLLSLTGDPTYQEAVHKLHVGSQLTATSPRYRDMMKWLVWPGATLMVVSALVSLSFSWRSAVAALSGLRGRSNADRPPDPGGFGRGTFAAGLALALVLSVCLQVSFFAIVWWAAVSAVLLSFVLALVAARVSGETGITPVGPMSKVSQLVFGALIPHKPAPNLMAANVTGGAASQCADLLHDMKCGYLLGASARLQSLAQICGAFAGALAGSAAYLVLVQNPAEQLFTDELPAPAVAAVKAVADLFKVGFSALPQGTPLAMLIAAGAGVILPIIERTAPKRLRPWTLSAASLGLAFVFPASISVAIFIGGLIAFILGKLCHDWTTRFLITICAGIVAGDSLTSVGIGIHRLLAG